MKRLWMVFGICWLLPLMERQAKGFLADCRCTMKTPSFVQVGQNIELENHTMTFTPRIISKGERWRLRYEELCEFKKQHGHCNVPSNYPQNMALVRWINHQRQLYRVDSPKLSPERIQALEAIDFQWRQTETWDSHFQQLCQYAAKHGHCSVGLRDDAKLRHWVKNQRYFYRCFIQNNHTSMTQERIDKLLSIGFDFDTSAETFHALSWMEKYNELLDYQKQNGGKGTFPSRRDQRYSALNRWLDVQRKLPPELTQAVDDDDDHHHDNISPENATYPLLIEQRIRLLKKAGYCWGVQQLKREKPKPKPPPPKINVQDDVSFEQIVRERAKQRFKRKRRTDGNEDEDELIRQLSDDELLKAWRKRFAPYRN